MFQVILGAYLWIWQLYLIYKVKNFFPCPGWHLGRDPVRFWAETPAGLSWDPGSPKTVRPQAGVALSCSCRADLQRPPLLFSPWPGQRCCWLGRPGCHICSSTETRRPGTGMDVKNRPPGGTGTGTGERRYRPFLMELAREWNAEIQCILGPKMTLGVRRDSAVCGDFNTVISQWNGSSREILSPCYSRCSGLQSRRETLWSTAERNKECFDLGNDVNFSKFPYLFVPQFP